MQHTFTNKGEGCPGAPVRVRVVGPNMPQNASEYLWFSAEEARSLVASSMAVYAPDGCESETPEQREARQVRELEAARAGWRA